MGYGKCLIMQHVGNESEKQQDVSDVHEILVKYIERDQLECFMLTMYVQYTFVLSSKLSLM